MYFARGNLPWQERYLGVGKGGTKEDKYRRILDKKDRLAVQPVGFAWSLHDRQKMGPFYLGNDPIFEGTPGACF